MRQETTKGGGPGPEEVGVVPIVRVDRVSSSPEY